MLAILTFVSSPGLDFSDKDVGRLVLKEPTTKVMGIGEHLLELARALRLWLAESTMIEMTY